MAQTQLGADKIAAQKIGVSLDELKRRREIGEKWCFRCRAWHEKTAFGSDVTRRDGLDASCRQSRNEVQRLRYQPRSRALRGRSFTPPRDGDKKQARRRINYFVEAGLIPRPCALPCTDCSKEWRPGQDRHEYDHYLGYAAEHHEHVQVVCSGCHHEREYNRRRKEDGGK